MHKRLFSLCVGVNLSEFNGQMKIILIKKIWEINLSTPNHAESENCALMYNKNLEEMWFRRPFFYFAYLNVKDTKDRMLSDRFEFSTPKLCEKWEQILHLNV